jgi:hypothetical protein
MKNKIRYIILIVLLCLSIFLILNNKSSTLKKEYTDFAVNDTASITKIFLADKANNSVKLVRQKNYWTVNNKFIAREDLIKILLKTICQIEIQSPVPKVAYNTVISSLATNSTKVEIYQNVYMINLWGLKIWQHEKLTKVYYVGHATQDQQGTYMLLEGAKAPYVTDIPSLRGFLTPRYIAKEIEWRERIIGRYKPNDIASIKLINYKEPNKSFEIKNNSKNQFSVFAINENNRQLENPNIDKIKKYILLFQKLSLEAYLYEFTQAEKDSIKKTGCIYSLTITNSKGQKNTINMYHKGAKEGEQDINGKPLLYDRDRMFAFINNDKDFVQLQYYEYDNILKPVTYFEK